MFKLHHKSTKMLTLESNSNEPKFYMGQSIQEWTDHTPLKFLKAILHKFYLVHSLNTLSGTMMHWCFNFSFLSNANHGMVLVSKLLTNNRVTWNVIFFVVFCFHIILIFLYNAPLHFKNKKHNLQLLTFCVKRASTIENCLKQFNPFQANIDIK